MRTTLAIDDDVLIAARALAESDGRSLGQVISDLARKSLRRGRVSGERNGVPLLTVGPNPAPVTLGIVNTLRDEST